MKNAIEQIALELLHEQSLNHINVVLPSEMNCETFKKFSVNFWFVSHVHVKRKAKKCDKFSLNVSRNNREVSVIILMEWSTRTLRTKWIASTFQVELEC